MKWRLFLLTFIVIIHSNGQGIRLKNFDLFKKVYQGQIDPISTEQNEVITFFTIKDNPKVSKVPHQLIKNKEKLYIIVETTGRIYEVENSDKDSVEIKRIDSTHFYGYNNDAIYFSFNDTIYSFGGSGFWHKNGQLRYYCFANHEWEIKQIDKEIPSSNILFYKDELRKCLYYITLPFIIEVTGEKINNHSFYKLDLINRTNTEIGEMPENILNLLQDKYNNHSFISLSALGGLLVNFNTDNQYLFLFDKNEVYKLKNEKIRNIIFGSSKRENPIFSFSKNNFIYYTKNNDSQYKVDSFKIEMNDFVKEPYPLFEKPFRMNNKDFNYAVPFLFLLGFTTFIYVRKKWKKTKKSDPVQNESDVDSELAFNVIETELIKKLIDAGVSKRQLSVEDINVVLGLGKKSLEIQKKGRTEAINRINHKFKVIYNVNVELIERIRSNEDRRFYKYMISDENMLLLKGGKKIN